MNSSTPKLTDDDRRAIDLLLDHNSLDLSITRMAAHASSVGISTAAETLNALSIMPANDPPADLVARTLNRIFSSSATPVGEETSLIQNLAMRPPV